MKKIILPSFAAAALLFVAARQISGAAAPSTKPSTAMNTRNEKTFARQVLDCVKSNNVRDWCALFPARKEFADLLRKMAAKKVDGMTPEVAEMMIAQQAAEGDGFYVSQLQDLRKLGADAGLDWDKAVYGDFIFEVGPSSVDNRFVNGDVWFKAGKTKFVLQGVEGIETPNGWRLQNVQIVKKIDDNE